jgi:hypothetical protein
MGILGLIEKAAIFVEIGCYVVMGYCLLRIFFIKRQIKKVEKNK